MVCSLAVRYFNWISKPAGSILCFVTASWGPPLGTACIFDEDNQQDDVLVNRMICMSERDTVGVDSPRRPRTCTASLASSFGGSSDGNANLAASFACGVVPRPEYRVTDAWVRERGLVRPCVVYLLHNPGTDARYRISYKTASSKSWGCSHWLYTTGNHAMS